MQVTEIAPNFWRVTARYGFMERPDIQRLLLTVAVHGCPVDVANVTYFVGSDLIVPRGDGGGLPHWFVKIFGMLLRGATPVSDQFNFPRDRVIQLGRRVAI